MNPVVFSTGFSACRRYIFGRCRRRSTWFDNLRFCVYESCAQSWTWKRNYTRKDFFRNRVYENYAPKPDSGEKLYMEGLFRKSCLWKSKSDADFRCQSPIKYTRFSKIASHVQSLLFGQGDVFILVWFLWDAYAERLFLFVCPPHSTAFIYLHIGPAPCKQTKKTTIFSLRADAALEYCSIFRPSSSAARKFLLANRVK